MGYICTHLKELEGLVIAAVKSFEGEPGLDLADSKALFGPHFYLRSLNEETFLLIPC
jgi:hypothetical protein